MKTLSQEINVRVDTVMKGKLIELAESEKRDLSDIARFAFEEYLAERERRRRQPELQLYAATS